MFCHNEGKIDRGVRVMLGLALMAGGLVMAAPWGLAWSIVWGSILGIVGLILLISGAMGWCPIYALFEFSTCCKDETPHTT
jgi:hypothetical protein